jgi:hypothetical protein
MSDLEAWIEGHVIDLIKVEVSRDEVVMWVTRRSENWWTSEDIPRLLADQPSLVTETISSSQMGANLNIEEVFRAALERSPMRLAGEVYDRETGRTDGCC